jgi:hypothetical protein
LGGLTVVALNILAITSRTEPANERTPVVDIRHERIFARMPPRVAQLESETQLVTAQVRALTVERDRLAGRIALRESSMDDMTGAIKKQTAATAAEPWPKRVLRRSPPRLPRQLNRRIRQLRTEHPSPPQRQFRRPLLHPRPTPRGTQAIPPPTG